MQPGSGPIPSKLMVVGEAWGEYEDRAKTPFVGPSGSELNRMLNEVGILRSQVYCTNLVNARPPNNDIGQWIALKKKDITAKHVLLRDRYVLPQIVEGYKCLMAEIEMVQPNLILALGGTAMWSLTGKWGILRWRGSQLRHDPYDHKTYKIEGSISSPAITAALQRSMEEIVLRPKVIPSIHPAAVLREWSLRPTVVADFRRASRHLESREYDLPSWNFIIRPSFDTVIGTLQALLRLLDKEEVWLDFDLETDIITKHIRCAGISWSRSEALCIPFTCSDRREGYWSADEELEIIWLLRHTLTHKNVRVRGQNLLFDAQYTWRYWHFIPKVAQDTMISWHSMFCGARKSLDHQASILCNSYVQWKPEKGSWAKGKEGG